MKNSLKKTIKNLKGTKIHHKRKQRNIPHLCYVRDSTQERHHAYDQHQHFVTDQILPDPTWKAILYRSYHHFDDRELKIILMNFYNVVNINENWYYLAIQGQTDQHEEEEYRPELRSWHFGHSLRIHNENQTRT